MSRKLLTGADFNNQRGTSVADPTSATDIANKQYVDNLVNGLVWKQPVRVATTANGTLATAYANGQSMDGVTLTTGMRILLKDQSTGADNGIYTVNASGAPTRTNDADSSAELQNATVYVVAGTVNADKSFTQTANDVNVGTTAQVWAQAGGGSAPTSGSGAISVAGTAISWVPKAGGSLAQDGSGAYVDSTKIANKYAGDVPSGSTTATIAHGLGTVDRLGEPLLTIKSTGEVVEADITLGTASDTVVFAVAPTTGQYRYSTAA